MQWVDFTGSVVADTIYVNGALAARNATVTLPSVTPLTAEIKAGGTIEVPITGQFEAMELAITFQGPDAGMRAALGLKSNEIEVRWVQDSLSNDGTVRQIGCKAFFRAIPKEVAGLSIEVGSAAENEFTFGATRYRLVVDGEEYLLIDQLNGIAKVNGTDYAGGVEALL